MEKKIKILYLYSSKGFGGIVQNLSLLTKNLHKDRFDVFVISLANEGDTESDLRLGKESGVVFCRIDEKHPLDLESLRQIDVFIKKHGIDILSCHGPKADIYGFILRKFYNNHLKLVAVAHGWVTPGLKLWLYCFLDKLVIRYFDKIIFVSPTLLQDIRGFMIPKKKIFCIDNAIEPDEFKKKGNSSMVRKAFSINDNDFVIGFTGRLSKEKNVETILFALKELLRTNKEIVLFIAGDGPLKDSLFKLVEELGIKGHVIFAGYQKDIKEIYSIFDLYVLASFREGLSNSLLEAQAIGIPCITSDIDGNDQVISNGENGFLFDPKDHKDLAEKISILMKNKDLAGRFILNGQRIIMEKFSLRERISKFEKLYYELFSTDAVS